MTEEEVKGPAPLADGNRADRDSKATVGAKDSPDTISSQAKWNAANPLALWAHNAVRSAIRRGIINRKPCEICGAEPADAHHDDHTRPLAIRWLCRTHHQRLHAEKREEAA
ncbi:hypothetical protein [Acuticoccus mangrovi]|uniref:Uncharacterized protein n=1 Tax=Acuticoccus mangrovi TaxID=2796142 RepID=A0A934ISL7_9HYPH|nr:hypothetical protein [Acuticoccus mangrovi]MBJ3777878.1 hypothetical protein [Acuticoccus mangrovi]